MANPTYNGQGQPPATSGGWLSGWFGASTPAYKLAPTTTSTTSTASTTPSNASASQRRAFFAFGAPAYKLAPQSSDSADVPQQFAQQFAIVIPRRALDSIDSIEPTDPQQ
ncbi:MAG TPA: hypothetical protein VGL61_25350 [Kofleriaceae bacterium]|jgi:hypothetical protein